MRFKTVLRSRLRLPGQSCRLLLNRSGSDQRQLLADAYGQMGKVYHAYDFSDAAEACYQNAMSLAPGDSGWPYALGRLYQERGEVKKSIEYLRLADRLRPNEIPVLVRLADAYVADGQSEAARELFERSLKLDESLVPQWQASEGSPFHNGTLRRPSSLLNTALRLQPSASSLHYPLAMAYRGTGERQLAQEHLLQQGPGKPSCPDPLHRRFGKAEEGGNGSMETRQPGHA